MAIRVPPKVSAVFSALRKKGAKCTAWVAGFFASFFSSSLKFFKAVPGHLKKLWRAVIRYRPPERAWTVFLGLLAAILGAILIVAPARELATGRTFGLQTLITLCWLATGVSAFGAGTGILLRLPSFRLFVKVACACSLPLAGAFVYRTASLAVRMRNASGSERDVLESWVSGGLHLSAFFVGVSLFLFFLLYSKGLRKLSCSGGILATRAGRLIGCGVGAAVGSAAGYLIWLLFRFLAFFMEIQWFVEAVYLVRVEYFIGGGALLCAVAAFWVNLGRRPTVAPQIPQGDFGP